MKLVERYLVEVGRHLSVDSREDILNELRDSLEEEIQEMSDDSESSAKIQSKVLNRLGHPIKVAAQYSQSQYLIGPELFPAFVQTLKTVTVITIFVVVAFQLLVWVTQGAHAGPSSLISNTIELGIWITMIVTICFVVLERLGERLDWYDDWTTDSLTTSISISRSDLMTNLITEGVFLLWWNDALNILRRGRFDWIDIQLSSAWEPLFWPINLIVGGWFLLHLWVLVRDKWSTRSLRTELALSFAAIAICLWLIGQSNLLQIGPDFQSDHAQVTIKITVLIVMGFIVWDAWLAFKRLKDSSIDSDS